MTKLFGTDGIRAVAGKFPLDYSSVCTLGRSLISLIQEEGFSPKVLIGRDTRESGEWLEQALFQGIKEEKGEPISVGIIPTSAISFLTKKHSFSAGIVISASHNSYEDNGIKIFSSQGVKISDEWEGKLEEAIISSEKNIQKEKYKIEPISSLGEEYSHFLQNLFPQELLKRKIKIIIDCSNGASSFLAPRIFSDLGFDITTLASSPSGKNINKECGSLHPENLAKEVLERKAEIGIAFDGDADRALWVDEKGRMLDGDHTLFVLSKFLKERDRLKSDYVVATTMSNLGLEKALEALNLKLCRTQVGDKYVLEQMIKLNANLGGEQSGHTIFLDDMSTGDGILTSIKMLEAMVTYGAPLSELIEDFTQFPQILWNVRVSKKEDFRLFPEIINTIEEIKHQLEHSGRMNVRYSGTEPVARIMIEGQNKKEIEKQAQKMADVIAKHLSK